MKIEHIKLKNLKPHPLNIEYYDNYDVNDTSNIRLQKSLKSTYLENGYPNLEIVYCDKNGIVYSGNRRFYGSKAGDLPFLRCVRIDHTFKPESLTNLKLKKIEKKILETYNQPGLKRDEYLWTVVLKKYLSDLSDYIQETGKPFTGKMRNEWCAERTNKKSKEFSMMVDVAIKYNRPELIKKVESGEYSVKDAFKEAGNIQPPIKEKEDKDRKNWIQFFRDKPELMERVVKYANDMLQQFVNINVNNRKIPQDDTHGHEQNMISTNLSNFYMSALSLVLEEEGFKSFTPREEAGLPDVRIKCLSKPGCHPERIEVKVAKFNGHGSKTNVFSGAGTIRIVPHTFLIVVYDPNTNRQFVALSDLTKDDWTSNSKNTKCEMGMNIWADNHLDNCVFFHGDGYIDNRNVFNMNLKEVK
jgi:hypothetical protein